MARMCVLGGGLVGRFVACTLYERDHTVRVVDAAKLTNIPSGIETIQVPVELDTLPNLVDGFDVVINCLPGRIGDTLDLFCYL